MALNRLEQMLVDQYTNINYPRMEPEPEPPAEGEMPFEPYQVAQAGPGVTGPGGAAFGVFPGAGRRRPENNSDIGQRMVQGAPDFAAGAARGFTTAALGLPGDVLKLGRFIYQIASDNQGGDIMDKFARAAEAFDEPALLQSSEEVSKEGFRIPGTQITIPMPPAVPPGKGGMGLTPQQRETAAGAGQFVGELVGDPVALVKGGKAAVKGVKAGAKALAPKAGEMLGDYMQRTGLQMNLMAYHGSPKKFDKFDSTKIGSGEGAQAYGYGLYFAESRDVADSYRIRLSYDPSQMRVGGRQINDLYSSIEQGAARMSPAKAQAEYEKLDVLERLMMNQMPSELVDHVGSLSPATKSWFEKTIVPSFQTYGNMYTVDIPDALVAKMLDFDAPLRQQSPEIQALASKYNLSMDDLGGDLLAAAGGKTAKGARTMQEAGIPGVRYLDQGSRGDGNGTRNIVVFPGSENQIKIIKTEGAK